MKRTIHDVVGDRATPKGFLDTEQHPLAPAPQSLLFPQPAQDPLTLLSMTTAANTNKLNTRTSSFNLDSGKRPSAATAETSRKRPALDKITADGKTRQCGSPHRGAAKSGVPVGGLGTGSSGGAAYVSAVAGGSNIDNPKRSVPATAAGGGLSWTEGKGNFSTTPQPIHDVNDKNNNKQNTKKKSRTTAIRNGDGTTTVKYIEESIPSNACGIFQIYGRRMNLDLLLDEANCSNKSNNTNPGIADTSMREPRKLPSIFALMRAWVQDDPYRRTPHPLSHLRNVEYSSDLSKDNENNKNSNDRIMEMKNEGIRGNSIESAKRSVQTNSKKDAAGVAGTMLEINSTSVTAGRSTSPTNLIASIGTDNRDSRATIPTPRATIPFAVGSKRKIGGHSIEQQQAYCSRETKRGIADYFPKAKQRQRQTALQFQQGLKRIQCQFLEKRGFALGDKSISNK